MAVKQPDSPVIWRRGLLCTLLHLAASPACGCKCDRCQEVDLERAYSGHPPNHDLSSPLGASRRLGWCLSFFRLCPISSAGAREDYVSRHLRLGAFRSRYVWLSGLWPLKYTTTHRLLRQPSFSCICVSVIFTPRPPTLPLEFTCNHSQK